MTHKKRSKLPNIRLKNYGIPKIIYAETNNRSGNNDIIFKFEKGQIVSRSKHSYFMRLGRYKLEDLKVVGIDLVE